MGILAQGRREEGGGRREEGGGRREEGGGRREEGGGRNIKINVKKSSIPWRICGELLTRSSGAI